MVPGVVYGITGNASRDPSRVNVVPNIPLVSTHNAALIAPYQAEPIEVHADVELQDLRHPEVRGVKVGVIREVVQRRKDCVSGVSQALSRILTDHRNA